VEELISVFLSQGVVVRLEKRRPVHGRSKIFADVWMEFKQIHGDSLSKPDNLLLILWEPRAYTNPDFHFDVLFLLSLKVGEYAL
jgi:hypothetical protein